MVLERKAVNPVEDEFGDHHQIAAFHRADLGCQARAEPRIQYPERLPARSSHLRNLRDVIGQMPGSIVALTKLDFIPTDIRSSSAVSRIRQAVAPSGGRNQLQRPR